MMPPPLNANAATPLGPHQPLACGVRPRAADLQRELRERARKRTLCFDEVLAKAYAAVAAKAELNWTRTVFEVPRFVIGMPIYDIEPCVRFLARRMTRDGYAVEVFPPNIMYISWDVEETRLSAERSRRDAVDRHRGGNATSDAYAYDLRSF